MRYAVFADVHANLEAFEAVMADCRQCRIDRYLFVGDIVGYGADPRACIERLRRLKALMAAGNHDRAACGLLDSDYFNETAKRAVLWTRGHIGDAEREFLTALPLVQEEREFCLVHGTLSQPEAFGYMTDGPQAVKSFCALKQKLCFVAHLHVPGVFIEDSRKVAYKEAATFALRGDQRYIINVGSIGQPRDGDARACFCVYDEAASAIEFRRVRYDISSAQKKMVDAGLPRSLAERLALGR